MTNMEVVAWRIYDAVTDAKSLADEYVADGWQVEPLVTLTSAQAEIERDQYFHEATHLAIQNDCLTIRAEAAEKERDALREALKPFAFAGTGVDLDRFDEDTIIEVHLPRVSPRKAIPAARICVGDILRARSALQPHEPHDAT